MLRWVLVFCSSLLLLVGCERKRNRSQNPTNTNWTNLLETCRATILKSSWEQAENCWANLKTNSRNPDHLQQWIQLQVDILEKTEADPSKNELRLGAIQEMYWEKEASRQYLVWLQKSIETGVFKDQKVQQKAEELVRDLQGGKSTQ